MLDFPKYTFSKVHFDKRVAEYLLIRHVPCTTLAAQQNARNNNPMRHNVSLVPAKH